MLCAAAGVHGLPARASGAPRPTGAGNRLAALVIYGCSLVVNLYGWRLTPTWSAAAGLVGVRCHYPGDGVTVRLAADTRPALRELIGTVLAWYVLPDPLDRPARSWTQPRLLEVD